MIAFTLLSSQGILHPVVVTALVGNAGAALYGALVGANYEYALKLYYSKVRLPGKGVGGPLLWNVETKGRS